MDHASLDATGNGHQDNLGGLMEVVFDEAKHTYTLGTRLLPSVTTILKDVGLLGDLTKFSNDFAMTRGSMVHKVCEMWDIGTLDEESVDPQLAGYFAAYKKFRGEMDIEWTEIEKPRHDAALGYAGTPDRVGNRIVLDIKTGSAQAWHGPQLAAYTMLALEAPLNTLTKRYGLYLAKDGTYKLKRYESRSDFDIFRACVTVFHAKRGIK